MTLILTNKLEKGKIGLKSTLRHFSRGNQLDKIYKIKKV